MIRWIVRIGALVLAYRLGEEVGRAQARVERVPGPPLDYERLPSDGNKDEFSLGPF
jgi:hypothetical protein